MGILPVALFASGHTYFVQHMADKLGMKAYVVHATFQFSGTHGKRHRLREALLWDVDPPGYFNPPGGLLVFTADVPAALLTASNSLEGHFALVNHQLLQIRDALALAQALGRTLVLPKLYCGWDRWWAPHNGRIPNSNLDIPYLCPMDHVLDPEVWSRKKSMEEAGPNIDFREYSFMDNPRITREVLDSRVLIRVCLGAAACAESAPTGMQHIDLTTAVSDAEARSVFETLSSVKVLDFSSMLGVFSGWERPVDQERFYRCEKATAALFHHTQHRRVRDYAGIWCCINRHPGHIW